MAEQQPSVIQGEHRTASIELGPPRDYYIQLPYRLSQLEFRILSRPDNKLDTLAFAFLTGAAIALINAVAKLWLPDAEVSPAELVAPGAIALVGIVVFGVGRLVPNEHRRLVRQIEEHFRANPNVGASMDLGDDNH